MSAIIEVRIEGIEEIVGNLESLRDALQSSSEGLQESIQAHLMPELEEASATVWNVRTGAYSTGWISEIESPNTCVVRNTALSISDGYPYPDSLEFGWTTRAGTIVESPGVLFPTAFEMLPSVTEGLIDWLVSKAAGIIAEL